MKRRWMLLVCTLFAACQLDSNTNETKQAASGCQFCGAKMPPSPYWVPGEQVPLAGPGKRFIVWSTKPGEWIAMLADPGAGQITWARHVVQKDFKAMIGDLSVAGMIDISRPPPPPPPPDGGDWMAPTALDLAYRIEPLPTDVWNDYAAAMGL